LDAAGAAYIFTRSGSTWTQQAKLTASDAQIIDHFGYSVSISGDGSYVIVGAKTEDGGAGNPIENAGAAYIFTRSGSTWTEQTILRAPDATLFNNFGRAVDINSDGTYVVVGSPYENTVADLSGAAYIFTRSGSTWTQQAKIKASDAAYNDWFGESLAINPSATVAVIGALNNNGERGAAYVFTRSGSTWTQERKITASDGAQYDHLGNSVSMSSNGAKVIVGAHDDDDDGVSSGAAYIYEAG